MTNRTSPALQIVRQFLVRALATNGMSTVKIGESLHLSRSFTIKQAHILLKPRNAAERRILKIANENKAKLQRMGIGGLLGGEDIVTTLAGGERPKLGPLAERRAKVEKAAQKAKPTAKATSKPKAKVKAKPAAPATKEAKAPKPAPKAKKSSRQSKLPLDTAPPLKGKAMDRMLGSVAAKHIEQTDATIEDLLGTPAAEGVGDISNVPV